MVHRAKHVVSKHVMASAMVYDPFGDDQQINPEDVRITNILNTVFNSLLNVFNKFDADHVVAAFDTRSWRRDFYNDYKSARREKVKTPDEEEELALINHVIDQVRDFLQEHTNVTVLECPGAEADDLLARWSQIHHEDEFVNIVVSADSDFKQLVNHNTHLYNPMSYILYTRDGVFHQDRRKKRTAAHRVMLFGQDWYRRLDKNDIPEMFDPEWELFEKCIRGDRGDSITAAWPGVRLTKMKKAFNGDVKEWNDFINSTWGKDGKKHSVRELYERNKTLIDLTQQPEYIQDMLDETIADALDKNRVRMIGAHFGMFCGKFKLKKLLPRSDSFTYMLAKSYA